MAKTNTCCPPKRVPSADRFFSLCRPAMQPPRARASEDNAALGSLQASPQAPSQSTGVAGVRGIAWTRTGDVQAIGRILHSTRSAFTGCTTQEPHDVLFYYELVISSLHAPGYVMTPFLGSYIEYDRIDALSRLGEPWKRCFVAVGSRNWER
ncbi:UNVERIFIED_CONTAM: hypothetical protein FKN15_006018 [Acipenser sinensis]